MNGQYLMNRPLSITYAFKKDTKGERHGTPAERLLAAQKKSNAKQASRPHTLFATGPGQAPGAGMEFGQPPPGPMAAMGPTGFAAGMPMPLPPAMPPMMGVPGGWPRQQGWAGGCASLSCRRVQRRVCASTAGPHCLSTLTPPQA